jgi:V/A-type H+-transporting ATPase subunit B
MEIIVGEGGLSEEERQFLQFADRFESEFIEQGRRGRSIEETLAIGWRLLSVFPASALTRIKREFIERYREGAGDGARATHPDGAAEH